MSHCDSFKVQLCCHRDNQEQKQPSQTINVEQLYQKFSKTLEQELRHQDKQKNEIIQKLQSQIFNLKSSIQRLEIRNKHDQQSQKQLRNEYHQLSLQMKQQSEIRPTKQIQIIEKIKQIQTIQDNPQIIAQNQRLKRRLEQALNQNTKTKLDKQLAEHELKNINEQLLFQKRVTEKLKQEIIEFKLQIQQKDNLANKLNQQIQYLKNNRDVIVQTQRIFPDFKASQKIRTETKIETIYIERPVQKIVFVEVEKHTKQFIKPEKAVVNRIINCQPTKNCRCQQQEITPKSNLEVSHLREVINQLEANIKQYRSQRQKLVDIISSKNSELNRLETHLRLYGHSSGYQQTFRGEPDVRVTVTKNHEPPQKQEAILKKQTKNTQKNDRKRL